MPAFLLTPFHLPPSVAETTLSYLFENLYDRAVPWKAALPTVLECLVNKDFSRLKRTLFAAEPILVSLSDGVIHVPLQQGATAANLQIPPSLHRAITGFREKLRSSTSKWLLTDALTAAQSLALTGFSTDTWQERFAELFVSDQFGLKTSAQALQHLKLLGHVLQGSPQVRQLQ